MRASMPKTRVTFWICYISSYSKAVALTPTLLELEGSHFRTFLRFNETNCMHNSFCNAEIHEHTSLTKIESDPEEEEELGLENS